MVNVSRLFPQKQFSKTSMDDAITRGDRNLVLMPKTEKNQHIYTNFNEQFNIFLKKLPNNHVRKQTTDLYNRDKIYIVISTTGPENGIFSRTLINNQNRCLGVGLLSNELNINIETGDVRSIDECIYAAYQGLIRTGSIIFRDRIKRDADLHKLLATYFFLVVLKSLGKMSIYSDKQKNFIYIVCLYAYYRHYLGEHPRATKSIIEKHFKDERLLQYYEEFEPRFDDIEKYSSTNDLAKMLIDTRALVESPNSINLSLMRNLGLSGYYSLFGPLDLLLSMCLLSAYPTEMYSKPAFVDRRMQTNIESKFVKDYMSKIKYEDTDLLRRGN